MEKFLCSFREKLKKKNSNRCQKFSPVHFGMKKYILVPYQKKKIGHNYGAEIIITNNAFYIKLQQCTRNILPLTNESQA